MVKKVKTIIIEYATRIPKEELAEILEERKSISICEAIHCPRTVTDHRVIGCNICGGILPDNVTKENYKEIYKNTWKS